MTDNQILSTSPMKQSVSMTSLPPASSSTGRGDNDTSDSSIAAKVLIDRPYNSLKVRALIFAFLYVFNFRRCQKNVNELNISQFRMTMVYNLIHVEYLRSRCCIAFQTKISFSLFANTFFALKALDTNAGLCPTRKTPFTFFPLFSLHCFRVACKNTHIQRPLYCFSICMHVWMWG